MNNTIYFRSSYAPALNASALRKPFGSEKHLPIPHSLSALKELSLSNLSSTIIWKCYANLFVFVRFCPIQSTF